MSRIKKLATYILFIGIINVLFGVTYAFFNYTRTGSSNTIQVGSISFESTNGTAINLNNIFPISRDNINNETDYVGSVTVNVSGDTTYAEGVEYLISVVDVNNIIYNPFGIKTRFPISVDVTYTANGNGNTIGTPNDNYFDEGVRGGDTSYYKVLANRTIRENSALAVGYIAPNSSGINGNIVIKAFIDEDKVAISDTFPEETKYVLNNNLTSSQINYCVNFFNNPQMFGELLEGENLHDFCVGTGTAYGETFQDMLNLNGIIPVSSLENLANHNIIHYSHTNLTTDDWLKGRTILTTQMWNNMQNNGVSFKVKVEANEGIWVDDKEKIDTCPGCKFMYAEDIKMYTTWNENNETPTVVNPNKLTDNYLDIVDGQGKNFFLGLILNDNNQITRGFICGIKSNTPFCIEGISDGSKYSSTQSFLQQSNLWNGMCETYLEDEGESYEHEVFSCYDENDYYFVAEVHDHGCAIIYGPDGNNYYSGTNCIADNTGVIMCETY